MPSDPESTARPLGQGDQTRPRRVVSVSLGSSVGDKSVETAFLGQPFVIERRGTDGDKRRFQALLAELDGKVDAIGLGGTDLYVFSGGRRYTMRDTRRLASAARVTPVVDGSGLKNTLERETVRTLDREGVVRFKDKRVLLVCGVDRFGMAEALRETGCDLVIGDLMFGLGLGIPIHSWRLYLALAAAVLPVISWLPIEVLYPTGDKQRQILPKFRKWYEWADVIAGDCHYIRRHMPPPEGKPFRGKTILTTTSTQAHVEEFRERGAELLVTTTPELDGRSFGTNVMEGVLLSLSGKRPEEVTPQDYLDVLKRLNSRPRIQRLQE
ncbi:MAG TPA: quinate 5-dehydrogenase [Armatimonadota bacterium]|jgi:hypothetical protein